MAIQPLFKLLFIGMMDVGIAIPFIKLCFLELCYSASLRVAVYWLISFYLHYSLDFTFTMTIGFCSSLNLSDLVIYSHDFHDC